MDLVEINSNILKSLSKRFNVKYTGDISPKLIQKINSKLSVSVSSGCDLDSLIQSFQSLGINISHINVTKVKEGDELHTYLLLDFLNVLFEALLADNPDEFNQLLLSYRAEAKKIAKHSRHSRKSGAGFGTTNSKAGGNGGTTSGAEEVERILQEARRKYGKISSLKKNVEANISMIKKIPADFSQVDNAPKYSPYKLTKASISTASSIETSSFRSRISSSSKTSSKSSVNLEISKSKKSAKSSEKSGKMPEKLSSRKSGQLKRSKENVSSTAAAEVLDTTENEVNIRIPLDEASINVKVKSLDGKSLGNRRVHVRLQEESSPSPPPKKPKIQYGTKSVLYHHHRKTRPPMFSKKPEPLPLTDNQALDAAVKIIKKRKHEEILAEEGSKKPSIKRQKPSTNSNVDLQTQKYLRDIRTRNGKLRKIAADLGL